MSGDLNSNIPMYNLDTSRLTTWESQNKKTRHPITVNLKMKQPMGEFESGRASKDEDKD